MEDLTSKETILWVAIIAAISALGCVADNKSEDNIEYCETIDCE